MTTHARSLFLDATLSLAGMTVLTENHIHRSTRPAEIRSEKHVKKAKEAVCNFLNPFDVEAKYQLLILSSGAVASAEVKRDVLNAETLGEKLRDAFI